MRWLVVHPGPHFSVADVYAGWCEGLRDNGQKVSRYALDDRLTWYGNVLLPAGEGRFRRAVPEGPKVAERAIDGLYSHLYRWRPDVLMVVSGFFVGADLLDLARSYGTRVVLLHTESPYEDGRQIEAAAHADLNLINDPTNIEKFQQVAPTEYVPHAYRPHIHHPGEPAGDVVDFSFIGTGYPSRVAFLQAMHAVGALDGLDVLLGGNWQALPDDSPLRAYVGHDLEECVDNAVTADVYRSTRVGLNLYRREAERPELCAGWAMGPREVEMAACGLFYLRDPRPEGDELLHMLPTFTTPGEAGELLRWWLDHEDTRRETARLARKAISDRTFHHHAARLLRRLDKQGR